MPDTQPLSVLAKVIRSKNAGPWELTLDVMFSTQQTYEHVRDSGVLTRALIAQLYSIDVNDVVTCVFFEPALAFKATILRSGRQGSVGEHDTFGAQQYAPLLDIAIPIAD